MNTVYRYFRIWALMVLSTQLVLAMDADMAGEVLFNAVRFYNIDNIHAAIQAGANVNMQDQHGRTALMYAVMNNRALEIVNALIAAGADVNVQDQDGATALMDAVDDGSLEVVNALIAAGANLNLRDRLDRTALVYAAINSSIEIVNALIAAGADVNWSNRLGDTALMQTMISNRSLEIVNALIAAGADVNVQNRTGNTPLTKAKENIHILMKLLQALCDNNKLYDQLYAISEDQSIVIAQVESIMQQVEQQALPSEQKQRILEELQGYLDSYSHGLK